MREGRPPSASIYAIRTLPMSRRPSRFRRSSCAASLGQRVAAVPLLLALMVGGAAGAGEEMAAGPQSGLPVPRFVTLKSDRVNVRGGPTKDHEVIWVFTRAGLPVEITAEFENWRRIRDWEGAEGWVYHSLLSGRRSAFVVKRKASEELAPLYDSSESVSTVKARLEPGVLGQVKGCNGTRCRFVGEQFDGYVAQERLWGVYPNEKTD